MGCASVPNRRNVEDGFEALADANSQLINQFATLCITMQNRWMTSVAVAGASGYAGGEILRLLDRKSVV